MSQDKDADVVIYCTSVPSSVKVRADQMRAEGILNLNKIAHKSIDVATDRKYMQSRSKKTVLPQIFVHGEYKGLLEDLADACDEGNLEQWLNS